MDVSNSDADFDSYWEDEARNPNRNRIRIGRQYQATVPPLLKPGESDGRRLEELETLRWKPDNELSDQQLDQYLSVAKAVGLFARTIDNNYTQNTDSHIETNTTETATDSNENDNCDSDKNKAESSTSNSTNNKDHQIQSALKGLSDFVSSHHPSHHDIGCRVPTPPEQTDSAENESTNSLITLLSGEWTSKETKIFSQALETCGKNFGAIKKEFLPWKSVKSIIEYYYLGIDKDNPQLSVRNDKENVTSSESDFKIDSMTNFSPFDVLSSVSKFMTPHTQTQNNDSQKAQCVKRSSDETSDSEVKKSSDDFKTSSISGQEVKPLKAKPILPSAIQESNNNISTIGSLKFFLDGQLVLKLNAQQELKGQKCQWVESLDTSKRVRPLHKTSKRLLIERQDLDIQNHSNNHKYNNSDELDDASADSSDDDSMESNESALAQSPSVLIAKKAKVKIENSCHIPLPSPTSVSNKDQRNDGSNQCNRNVKLENCNLLKREHLSSPTNSLVNSDDEQKRKSFNFSSIDQKNEKRNHSNHNSLENKWYHTIVEKSSGQPPKAHSTSSIGQMHRFSRYDTMQAIPSLSSSSSSSSASSTSSSSSSSFSVPVTASLSTNAIPVDLTRKSTSCSPLETKSSPSTSSTPNSSVYYERDRHSKVVESPSPPRLQPPFVFPYPQYLPLSPTQSHHKIKKDVKSSNNTCQKVEGRIIKSSPPDSPSSIPSQPPLPSQIAWLQSSIASYLPIYEQYYRYYYGYGMPSTNHPSVERSSSQPNRDTAVNKEKAKCLTDAVLVDGDEANCGT